MITLDTIYRGSPTWLQTLFLNAYAIRIERLRRGKPYERSVNQLLESQYWSPLRIQAFQDERIREIVRTAYHKSPYYHRILSASGLTASDIRGRADLPRLPLLTRDALRQRSAELLTAPRPPSQWSQGHTSGTTGSPLSVWYDRKTTILTDAVDWRQKVWGGMTNGDWIGIFLGRVVVPGISQRPPFWRVNRIHRQVWFSSFHMTDENLGSYIEEVERRRLQFLEGYPSTLFTVAQYVVRRGITLPMRAVFTSSETLNELQSETIEAAFKCKPFDFYGHAERTIFATECETHDGKHLAEEYGFTEVVDDEGHRVADGEKGYLVGTSLHNTAMPLIRYRTGDISALLPEPCACGRTLRRIQSMAIKAEDLIVTPDGRAISPKILANAFKPIRQILNSQIVQDKIDHLQICLVGSEEFTAEHLETLRSSLVARLGPTMKLDIKLAKDIPRERSGKFRWVTSRIDPPSNLSSM